MCARILYNIITMKISLVIIFHVRNETLVLSLPHQPSPHYALTSAITHAGRLYIFLYPVIIIIFRWTHNIIFIYTPLKSVHTNSIFNVILPCTYNIIHVPIRMQVPIICLIIVIFFSFVIFPFNENAHI